MSVVEATTLFTAHATVSDGSRIARGRHVRVVVHPALGLPCAPFAVYRVPLGIKAKQLGNPVPLTWTGPKGPTTLPIELSGKDSATGWIPAGVRARMVWVRADKLARLEAIVDTADGPAVVGTREAPPWVVTAPRIDRVVASGPGVINDAFARGGTPATDAADKGELWLWSLPTKPAPWYAPTTTAFDDARRRTMDGAPPRLGLVDTQDDRGPLDTPPATAEDEVARVEEALKILALPLDAGLSDPTTAPRHRPMRYTTTTAVGTEVAFTPDLVSALSVATLDPGVARWMGYAAVDTDVLAGVEEVVAYVVRGLFRTSGFAEDPEREAAWHRALAPVLGAIGEAEGFWERVVDLSPLDRSGGFVDLRAVALVPADGPDDVPAAPRPGPGGPSSGPWLPDPAGAAVSRCRRQIPLEGLNLGAALAAWRGHSSGEEAINAKLPRTGRGILLIAGQGSEPGRTTVEHLASGGDATTYRIAQSDLFGRWSEWLTVDVPSASRPAPPPASAKAVYVPAASHPGVDLRRGDIRVQAQVPPPAAGGRPIAALEATLLDERSLAESTARAAAGAPETLVTVALAGPELALGERRDRRVVCRWIDADGTAGADSPIVPIVVWDARTPAPLAVDPLVYASPADTTGRAWATLRVPSGLGVAAARIFLAGEASLLRWLEANHPGDPRTSSLAAAIALDPAGRPPSARSRATALSGAASLAGRGAFELITGTPVPVPVAPATTYRWPLPGSLQPLAVFRIVPVSSSGAEPPFENCPVTCVAVPDDRTPATPVLRRAERVDGLPTRPDEVVLAAMIGPSSVAAARWRLLRSRQGLTSPGSMVLVAEGDVPATSDGSPQEVVVVDEGAHAGGPPRRWGRYTYRMLVRAAVPVDAPPGIDRWSAPSAPIAVDVVPPDGPAAPSLSGPPTWMDEATAIVSLPFRLPPLGRGPIGEHRIFFWRTPPNGVEQLVFSFTDGPPDIPGCVPVATDGTVVLAESAPQLQTAWRLTVVDPLGRTSPPSEPLRLDRWP